MTRIAVCIVTLRRPAGLRRALESVARLELPDPARDELVVQVVENESGGPGRAACEQAAVDLGLDVRFTTEPRRGIPFARNTALDATIDDVDVVAFLDDDEEAPPDWLVQLLACMDQHGADAATGPFEPCFPGRGAPPAWATRGGFFQSPRRYPTGTMLQEAYTGNVAIRCAALREHGTRFDPRLALAGGSDTHFFRAFAASGGRIAWCDDAGIVEHVPASRLTRRWVLRRALRIGTSTALVERMLHPGMRSRAAHMLKGGVRMLEGLLLIPAWAVLPGRTPLQALRLVPLGWGMLRGAVGRPYDEYEQLHGA